MNLILLLAAQAPPLGDCEALKGATAKYECRLAESLEQLPDVDCDDQQTQLDMNVCSYRSNLRAEIELNRVWTLASKRAKSSDRWAAERGFRGGGFDRLLVAQRHWIAFRDAQCALEAGPPEGGGSIWPLVTNSCLTSLTRARIGNLRKYMEPGE